MLLVEIARRHCGHIGRLAPRPLLVADKPHLGLSLQLDVLSACRVPCDALFVQVRNTVLLAGKPSVLSHSA